MVLRRLVNGTIAGGMLGAALSSHLAEQHWRTRDMYSERDDMGLPFFRQRLATDWPMTLQDLDRWDAMGRNHRREHGTMGGALGAAAGAVAGAALGRRPESPERERERVAYYDPNDPQTLHVPPAD